MNNGKVVAICKWFNDRLEDWLAMQFYHNHSVENTGFYSQLEKFRENNIQLFSNKSALISRIFFEKIPWVNFRNYHTVKTFAITVKWLKIYKYCWFVEDSDVCNRLGFTSDSPSTSSPSSSTSSSTTTTTTTSTTTKVRKAAAQGYCKKKITSESKVIQEEVASFLRLSTNNAEMVLINFCFCDFQKPETAASMTCPRSKDVTFSHVFTYQYRADLDPNSLQRTISDLCLLSSFRCESDKDCWFGRKCCSVKSKFHNNCKLCVFSKTE